MTSSMNCLIIEKYGLAGMVGAGMGVDVEASMDMGVGVSVGVDMGATITLVSFSDAEITTFFLPLGGIGYDLISSVYLYINSNLYLYIHLNS